MDGKFTITKTTVECFKIRHSSGTWADITIDAKEETGRIQIASDYGAWQFYWGSCGMPFKEFLASLDKHYVAGKFGCARWFDAVKTVAEFQRVIEEDINDGYLNASKGADALDELELLKNSSDQNEFCMTLNDCGQIMKLYDHCPSLIYGIDPSFENFWTKLWPVFIEQIN